MDASPAHRRLMAAQSPDWCCDVCQQRNSSLLPARAAISATPSPAKIATQTEELQAAATAGNSNSDTTEPVSSGNSITAETESDRAEAAKAHGSEAAPVRQSELTIAADPSESSPTTTSVPAAAQPTVALPRGNRGNDSACLSLLTILLAIAILLIMANKVRRWYLKRADFDFSNQEL